MKSKISTANAPAAIGPYSQAIKYGELLFVSGQLPIDPSTGNLVGGDIVAQTEMALKNLSAIIQASGLGLDSVLRCCCFLADMGDFAKFNEVYAKFLGNSAPARETVQVARLPKDARVEISAICGK